MRTGFMSNPFSERWKLLTLLHPDTERLLRTMYDDEQYNTVMAHILMSLPQMMAESTGYPFMVLSFREGETNVHDHGDIPEKYGWN
jgi:hypothetical protein